MVLLVKIDGEMGWVSTRAKHDQSVSPCYFSIFCLPVLEHQGHENARQLRNLCRRSGSQAHFGTFDAQKLYYKQKPIELKHNIYIISAIFCNGVCSTFIISPCTVHGLSLRVYMCVCVFISCQPIPSVLSNLQVHLFAFARLLPVIGLPLFCNTSVSLCSYGLFLLRSCFESQQSSHWPFLDRS